MINVLGESYYIDLDAIESYLDMSDQGQVDLSGTSEMKINIVKYEMIKLMLDVILTEGDEFDQTLGARATSSTSVPFKLAFNSLLNKKLINHY